MGHGRCWAKLTQLRVAGDALHVLPGLPDCRRAKATHLAKLKNTHRLRAAYLFLFYADANKRA